MLMLGIMSVSDADYSNRLRSQTYCFQRREVASSLPQSLWREIIGEYSNTPYDGHRFEYGARNDRAPVQQAMCAHVRCDRAGFCRAGAELP